MPRQERGERRLRQILDSTSALVLEMPPESVTTNHVARRAGANVATVYHFFSNKSEIFQAICSRAIGDLEKVVVAVATEPAAGAARWIRRIVAVHADFWVQNAAAIRLWEYVRARPAMRSVLSGYERHILPEYEKGLRRYCPWMRPARRKDVARVMNIVIARLLDDAALAPSPRERSRRLREIESLLTTYVARRQRRARSLP